MILDESGSMGAIYQQAITGVNETIQTIRQAREDHPDMEQLVTLASFNSGEKYLHRIYEQLPVEKVEEMAEKDYRPNACTALFDAMGEMLTEMKEKVDKEDKVLVTIITDGYENASQRWNGTRIKELVDQLRAEGWVFTYIGANQDVEKMASDMGINNYMQFVSDELGTREMFKKEAMARKAWMAKVHRNEIDLEKDYFENEPKPQPQPQPRQPEPKSEKRKSFLERLLGL